MSEELQVVTVPDPGVVAVPQPDIDVVTTEATQPVVVESPAIDVVTIDDEDHIVDQVRDIQIVTVGEQGPPGATGADGSDGNSNITKTAGVSLGGHRAVVLNSSGEAIYADSSILTHRDKVLGVTTGAASATADATIRTYGELVEPSWTWTLDEPVFLGLTGLLTQTVPTSGFVQRIGFPLTATSLFIDVDDAVTL
jgi:hypothetical protein